MPCIDDYDGIWYALPPCAQHGPIAAKHHCEIGLVHRAAPDAVGLQVSPDTGVKVILLL